MEASCPHLGADMSHADIEEYGDDDEDPTLVAVCPWHRYDFDLRTGRSETGMHTCTYSIDVRKEGDAENVYMETPSGGTGWRLIELRPVSEEFADPPPRTNISPSVSVPRETDTEDEPVVPVQNPPSTLMEWAVLILNTPDPRLKVERTRHAVHLYRTGKLKSIGNKAANPPTPPDVPPRHALYVSNTVAPERMKTKRGAAASIHALANIEQWALHRWDIMARFGPRYKDLPPAFFTDFTKMALDESKHFTLLTARLAALAPATPYGSLAVHAALWSSATASAASLRARLAIIHLVHEARGLDVNPATIARFRRARDMESVAALEVIHADEVTHVTTGHRWFTWVCAREGVKDPVAAFREEVRKGWRGDVKGPFNEEDREKAGLTPDFYRDLKGELGMEELGRSLGIEDSGRSRGLENPRRARETDGDSQQTPTTQSSVQISYETS
ncbi:hypothetical protein EV122DRAFT_223943 [Schizophyllum commune]